LAVKVTSSGPIFFGHKRLGKNGETFRCWKFRTMYPDAECRYLEIDDSFTTAIYIQPQIKL